MRVAEPKAVPTTQISGSLLRIRVAGVPKPWKGCLELGLELGSPGTTQGLVVRKKYIAREVWRCPPRRNARPGVATSAPKYLCPPKCAHMGVTDEPGGAGPGRESWV